MRGVILGEPFKRVQAAEPYRGLVAAELLDRLGVQLGDAPLGRVQVGQNGGDLLVMLAAEREHEAHRRRSAGACREAGADGVQPGVGLVGARRGVASDGYSQMITPQAVIRNRASAANTHRQNGMGFSVGLAPSCARLTLGNFMRDIMSRR